MNKDEQLKTLLASLYDCLGCMVKPDEYQMRHNILIRQLAAYVLRDDIEKLEGDGEDL